MNGKKSKNLLKNKTEKKLIEKQKRGKVEYAIYNFSLAACEF